MQQHRRFGERLVRPEAVLRLIVVTVPGLAEKPQNPFCYTERAADAVSEVLAVPRPASPRPHASSFVRANCRATSLAVGAALLRQLLAQLGLGQPEISWARPLRPMSTGPKSRGPMLKQARML